MRVSTTVEHMKDTIPFFVRTRRQLETVLIKKGLFLMIIAFLLGRAAILTDIMPFAIPFFATVFIIKRDKALLIAMALIAGSITKDPINSVFVFSGLAVFLITRKLINFSSKSDQRTLPFTIFLASLITRLCFEYMVGPDLLLLELVMAFLEAGLSLLLAMIFLQSVPLLTTNNRRHALRHEEIISLMILIASVMTGAIGWTVFDLSIANILTRYLVIVFAYTGGVAVGTTVGVVTGLIVSLASVSSLYQMSLLAFTGLLGGLLKENKKFGVAIALIISTLLIGLSGLNSQSLTNALYESFVAIALLFFTPIFIFKKISTYIPGTKEYSNEQQQYLRKVRNVTADRVEQFSSLFQALANSFSYNGLTVEDEESNKEVDYFLSNVTEKTCQTCFKKEYCWAENFNKTYGYMQNIMDEVEEHEEVRNKVFLREWNNYCYKSKKVIDAIKQELNYFQANKKLKRQVQESRKLVADQLFGVSQVMEDFAKEIQRERMQNHHQEEQILEVIQSLGLEILQIEIYSLEEGKIDIEITFPGPDMLGEFEKLFAPLLSDVLQETVVVKNKEGGEHPNDPCTITFGSTKAFEIETGVANAAKGGAWLSGDCYSTIELASSKYAIAISDGMGNGQRAHLESNETLRLLQKILQSGIEESIAIKSINSVLSLRSTDEIFSTLDLAMVDLQTAKAKFLKIGSIPSFIKRNDRVLMVQASNLPMGIIKDFEVDVVSMELKAGDLLIMMSDGIFDGPKHVENKESWLKRKLSEFETEDPQAVADLLLEEVINSRDGDINDDMTVVVAKVKRNIPKWATFSQKQFLGKLNNQ
ncbi:stage II sporulation protein E [Lottiidibacillus patelloidae]|uniref:Stage II sporulation protein E n=1 Tax=Lottiidibacillus patelloidae TaxID=2670334 RepID=A0A263BQ19_9BACI|nr:stage II sporulation protein E [Lottiidibacillus patelloidae]OZM55830.1 stage II sporulation protein E [Lottiidibacillus patelloidae]